MPRKPPAASLVARSDTPPTPSALGTFAGPTRNALPSAATYDNGRVLHELWDEGDGGWTFCLAGPRGDAARALLESGSRLVWTLEAASHFDAMTEYYRHQGWGVYTTENPEWDRTTYAEHGWE